MAFEDETIITQKPCIRKSLSFEGEQQKIEHTGSREKSSSFFSQRADLFQRKFPTLRDDVSINDYAELARVTALESLSQEDFKAKFNEFLVPKGYEFYFEIGKTTGISITR